MGAPIYQSSETQSRKSIEAKPIPVQPSQPVRSFSPKDGYRLSSQVYDTEPNPMLSLERRYVEGLLPPVAGLDVVDLGCGTGRWLATLTSRAPKTLLGVDLSSEMLASARRQLGLSAKLVVANCTDLPLPRSSADLILCAFLTSYVQDLHEFAEQVRRILRPGGTVFVSDLHPGTTSKLGWRRGFHVNGSFVDIATHVHTIDQLVSAFEHFGIRANAVIEPHFGQPELEILTQAGKSETFAAAIGQPVIYILQLGLNPDRHPKSRIVSAKTVTSLRGARVAFGPAETALTDVHIEHGRIKSLGAAETESPGHAGQRKTDIDLSGFLVLPGLVNAHDHLDFALFPRLGRGGYRNFVEWADDIYRPGESPVQEHRSVPKKTRLWWGGIRNLLCGVTTVCHHNPYVREVFDNHFAIRVLRDFRWAHSIPIDQHFSRKRENARPDQPFIIHLAEGVDLQSAEEVFHLVREHALDDRTVIVHGLGLDERGISLLQSLGAALIWCPTSNMFLFGRTHTRETIQQLSFVALGSDSPLTAQGDLLDEVRFAKQTIGMSAEELYSLITTRAAQVLRMKNGEGTLRVGAPADTIAVRDTGLSPADTLTTISFRDIELVVVGGRVQLASLRMLSRLPGPIIAGLRPLHIDGEERWIRAPLHQLFSETQGHLPGEIRLGGRTVHNGVSA